MDNEEIQSRQYMRKRLENLYDECKKTGDFRRLFAEFVDLIPKHISKDFRGDPEKPGWKSEREGVLEFLKWLVEETEKK